MRFFGFTLAVLQIEGHSPCGKAPPNTALQPTARSGRCADTLGLPCWVSMERAMKCGIGVCGTCHFGDRLVCRDGPVFEGREVLGLQQSRYGSSICSDKEEGT